METHTMNYSSDMIKRSAFVDELSNNINILPPYLQTQEIKTVKEYLERRIKELEKKYK
jgi:hypothetical protein